jgi:hypothetical protein
MNPKALYARGTVEGMNVQSDQDHRSPPQSQSEERTRRYMAGRCIEYLSDCEQFEKLQANNFLEMNFIDLTEFFVMQIGFESLEACYHHFSFRENYGFQDINAECERIKLLAVASKESHDLILARLRQLVISVS